MTKMTALRGAALMALLAAGLPAPASAQFGFIKKQLKNRIINTVVDSAANKVFGPATDSANDPRPRTPASAGGARAAASSQERRVDDLEVEITPRSLDGLEKYLTTLKARSQEPEALARALAPAGKNGDALSMVQYSLMTQRVVAFCAAAAPSGKGGAALSALSASSELYKAYKPTEMAALRPRCAHLLQLIGAEPDQP